MNKMQFIVTSNPTIKTVVKIAGGFGIKIDEEVGEGIRPELEKKFKKIIETGNSARLRKRPFRIEKLPKNLKKYRLELHFGPKAGFFHF